VLAARKKADDAFRANFERLKAERLAREAAVGGRIYASDSESSGFGWGNHLHRTAD
jgi:hypothetical protein